MTGGGASAVDMGPSGFFAGSYEEARAKFMDAAHGAGLAVESHPHPLRGRHGEELALDAVRIGPADARALLVVSSGCHGIEGFAGSGVQNAVLGDAGILRDAAAMGVAVLLVHAVNPWGFSWLRRWTHENVDLNRNFIEFGDGRGLPRNPGYDALASALVPGVRSSPQADAALWAHFHAHGERATQQAIAGGQYAHPDGLFYGGSGPTWSNHAMRQVLRLHGRACERAAWVDLHTATVPYGTCEVIFSSGDEAAALARARSWWGEGVTSLEAGESALSPRVGLMVAAGQAEMPQAEYLGVLVEFGTTPPEETLMALREDQWLHAQQEVPAGVREAIERRMLRAFYVDTPEWQAGTLAQGLDVVRKAVAGLGRR